MPDREQTLRYQRQTILPEIGAAGQEKLARSAVLVVGAGGLGSPVCMYLAAAGVGTIGIADADRVDITNLHRQIVHPYCNVGVEKTASAAETIARLNPETKIVQHPLLLTEDNAESLVRGYDAAVGCLDNFSARYALNAACVALDTPNIFGSVSRFEGQASVFAFPGPCYQCFFRQPPPENRQPDPLDKGILGPVAGTIGAVMATETIKALLGIGTTLSGRLLLMDALACSFRIIPIKPDPDCPVCGGIRKRTRA